MEFHASLSKNKPSENAEFIDLITYTKVGEEFQINEMTTLGATVHTYRGIIGSRWVEQDSNRNPTALHITTTTGDRITVICN